MKQGTTLYRYSFRKIDSKFKLIAIPFRYRFDPVPGTGGWRNHLPVRPSYRRMRVTQERRWTFAHREYVRGKRSFRVLPDPWDERRIADDYNRGWKRTKKKRQWM